jgi:hypothetical protein
MNNQPKADQLKTGKTLIIVGIVLLAVIAGVFWYVIKEQSSINNEQYVTNKKWVKDSQQLRTEFETFIKKHGQKIELEKVDTTNWKTYTDEKRKFSFQYPSDWHVVHIDSSWSLNNSYSKEGQRRERMIRKQFPAYCEEVLNSASDIKGCAEPYKFLCVTDKYAYERIPKKFRDVNSIKIPLRGSVGDYCNIILEESFPQLKSSKKSSGRMRLESYQAYSDFSHIKYVINDATYLITSTTPTTSFHFLRLSGNFITVRDTNFGIPIITQTIKYTE